MLRLLENRWFQILIILLLPFLAYLNILNNYFVWDDWAFINGWETPRSFSNFFEFLNGSAPIGMEGVYRPIKIILHSINIHLFGFQDLFLYHLQGILIHLCITLIVFFITKKLRNQPILALLTGLSFGLIPVHTESIAFATASQDLFGVLFIFISYLIYLYSEQGKNRRLFAFSLLFAFLGYFSNELTFPFFILLFITDYFFFNKKLKLYRKNVIYLYYALPVALYFLIRFLILQIPTRQSFVVENFYPTMLIMAKVVVKYTEILFFPLNLSAIPSISPGITGGKAASEALKSQTIFDPIVLFGIGILVFLAFLIFYFRKKHVVISFSIAWILISFIPFSNIIPTGIFYSERYLYLASFGFCLALSYVFFTLLSSKSINMMGKKIIILILVTLLVFYSFRTFIRTGDWKDNITLWSKTAVSSPNNPDILNNLGAAYIDNNDLEPALSVLRKAIEIDPDNGEYYHNIGVVYYKKRDDSNAIKYFEKAHSLDNNELFAIKIAQYYYDKKDFNKVEKVINTTKFINFKYVMHFFRGSIYLNKGDLRLAENELKKSIELKSNDPWAYNELASLYIIQNKNSEAENLLNKAISINSNFAPAYNNLAKVYASQNNFEKALSTIDRALELNPDYPEAQKTRDIIQKYFQQNILQFLQDQQ